MCRQNEKYDTGNGDETSSRYPREPYSLEKPSPHASFTAASAAFLRTHDKVNVAAPKIDARQRKRIELDLEKADALPVPGSGLLGQDSLAIEIGLKRREVRALLASPALELWTLDQPQNLPLLDNLAGRDL